MKVVKFIQEQNIDTMFLCYVRNKETINYCCIPVKVFSKYFAKRLCENLTQDSVAILKEGVITCNLPVILS